MKQRFKIFFGAILVTLVMGVRASYADDSEKKDPQVPVELAFVRSLDVDGYVQSTDSRGAGAQSTRVRLRYLDPDVNAFVGLLIGGSRFNNDLTIENGSSLDQSKWLWNWGGDFGVVRGIHLWELDLMGSVLGSHIGAALAVVGEHHVARNWIVYHRTEGDFFVGDAILDADQGVYWMAWKSVGFSAGYRLFASQHMSNRDGPHIGLRIYFENPKIPFIFPSIG